jgi:hypothetical protein
MAYANRFGLPEIRADFRAGQICSVSANIHRREADKPFQPGDFMPSLRVHEEVPEPIGSGEIDIEAQSKALAAMLGKREE